MPGIAINDTELHKQLKIKSALSGQTISNIATKILKIGLTIDLQNLSDEDLRDIKELVNHKTTS